MTVVCVYDPDGRLSDLRETLLGAGIECRSVGEWAQLGAATADADCLIVPDHAAEEGHEQRDAVDLYDRVRSELLIETPVLAYTTREGHRPIRRALDHGLADVIRVPLDRPELLRQRVRDTTDPESGSFDPVGEQFRSLLRSYPHTLFVKDRDGRFANVTAQTAEKYGFSREELVGMSDYELFSEPHADALREEERRIMAEEEPMMGKVEHYVDGAGNDQWVSTTKVPRYDADGEVVGVVGGTKYVTAAKRQEQLIAELHEASQRLARAPDRQTVAEETVAIATELDLFDHAEVAFAGSAGLEPAVAAGDTERLWEDHAETFRSAFETGEARPFGTDGATESRAIELDVTDANGESAGIEGQVVPLDDYGVLAVRLAPSESFDAFVDRLVQVFAANVVAALDRAERERELEDQRRRLEEFATLGTHELRNKLQVLMAVLEQLQAESDDERIDDCRRLTDRMDRILQQVLRLARTGEAVAHTRSTVDLASAAREAWEGVDARNARLVVQSTRSVEANREALVGLLEFLLENADEHGGTDVTVTVGALPDGFFVADNGRGIRDEQRAGLFEARYSEPTDEGYGLYVTASIAESHGWSIDVRESEGGGARFEITGVADRTG